MPYSNPITRLHPTAFVVLIDRSGSMKEKIVFAGCDMTKSRAVTLVINSFIDELLFRARREGGVRDYYDVALLGYSGDGVCSLISPDGEFVSPSRLSVQKVHREKLSHERILPSGRSTISVTEHNMWIDEKAVGTTPMCEALREGLSLVEKWCRARRNSTSYPPTVINITDGECSDGSTESVRAVAEKIRATGTADGNTLLMNIHLARTEEGQAVLFPSSPDGLPDHRYARLLYDISGEMPESYHDVIASMRTGVCPPFRAVAFNSRISDVAAMINIGSINSVML